MKITLVRGDITRQDTDVVVNAANSSLLGGGGVDGAIHRRGGPEILAECRQLRASRYGRGLPTGQAVATTAGELLARWVIHTVGPVHSVGEDRSGLLASCYRESLRVAGELGARSVAFPAISTGVYRWPMEDAARIALGTVRSVDTRIEDVRFVLFDVVAYQAFERVLQGLGPTDEEIEAVLAEQPSGRWEKLFALAGGLTDADLEVTWEGGTVPGEEGVYAIYSEPLNAVFSILVGLKTLVVFDWWAWHQVTPLFPDGNGLDQAPVADAARLATAFLRGERFSDGTIQEAIQNGALQAILSSMNPDDARPGLRDMDTYLLGRVNYHEQAAHWPNSTDEIAPLINDMTKIVFSETSASAVDVDNEIMQVRPAVPIFAPDGIERVEFYVNDRLLATDDIAPYEITVDRGPFIPQSSGKNTAFARAYDTDKPQLNADSQIVSFLLVDPPPGLPDEPYCP